VAADRARFAALAYLGTGGVAAAIIMVALVLSPPGGALRGAIPQPLDLLTRLTPAVENPEAPDLAQSPSADTLPQLALIPPIPAEVGAASPEGPTTEETGAAPLLAALAPNAGLGAGGGFAASLEADSVAFAQEIASMESEAPLTMSPVELPSGPADLAFDPAFAGLSFGEAREMVLFGGEAAALAGEPPSRTNASTAQSNRPQYNAGGSAIAAAPRSAPPSSVVPPSGWGDVQASSVMAPSVLAPMALSPIGGPAGSAESGLAGIPGGSSSASSPATTIAGARPHIGGGSNASVSAGAASSAGFAVSAPSAPSTGPVPTNVQISAPAIGGVTASASSAPSVSTTASTSAKVPAVTSAH